MARKQLWNGKWKALKFMMPLPIIRLGGEFGTAIVWVAGDGGGETGQMAGQCYQ
ncbi:MAG: hypothetical protein M1319_03010 [Chloroflexi bacterium]|nr:hypothetical protein [Chloroflexota bacterium]